MKRWLFYLWNFWPPYFGAGIQIEYLSRDMMTVRVRLKKRPWTRNLVGTQFGGSIYAMTDPFYMAILLVQFGREFIIWDKAASIRFRKPGTTELRAEFTVTPKDLREIRERLKTEPKIDWERDVIVTNAGGETVAEIHKVIHIRRKD